MVLVNHLRTDYSTFRPGVIFDENLTLKYPVAAVKKKAIGGLINIAKISKFIDRESKLKLVHGLILT